jgi:hypothetical protein
VSFDDLFSRALTSARESAFHLEQRDSYALADVHREPFRSFVDSGALDTAFMADWSASVREAAARGVEFRRLRIVSEPVSDYIRWEHAVTVSNIEAGESVRWLSRRTCPAVAVVPFDFWLFDGKTVLVNHFAGDGSWPEPSAELRTEPALVKLVAESFEAAWSRGIPHDRYTPA